MEKENHYLFMKLIPDPVKLMLDREEYMESIEKEYANKTCYTGKKIYSILDKKPKKQALELTKPHPFTDIKGLHRGGFSECSLLKENNKAIRPSDTCTEEMKELSKLIDNMKTKINERMNSELLRKSTKQLYKMNENQVMLSGVKTKASKNQRTKEGIKLTIKKNNLVKEPKESQYTNYTTEPKITRFSLTNYT